MPTQPEQGLIKYDWQEYFQRIKSLKSKITDSNFPITQLIGLTSGGIIPSLALGNMTGLRPAFIAIKSYRRKDHNSVIEVPSGQFCLKRELAMTQLELGRQVVIIDDLDEKGETLRISAGYVRYRHKQVNSIRTAVLWHKSRSPFLPDHYVELVEVDQNNRPYIVQPYENEFQPQVLEKTLNISPPVLKDNCIIRSWSEWIADIKKLIQLIIVKRLPINQIVSLTMGGLIPGLAGGRILDLEPAILAVKVDPSAPNNVVFARDLAMASSFFGKDVLVIDDKSLSPETLEYSTRWLKEEYGYQISSLFTAVLYHGRKGYPVDIAVHEIDPLPNGQMPKIIQPMEQEFPPL